MPDESNLKNLLDIKLELSIDDKLVIIVSPFLLLNYQTMSLSESFILSKKSEVVIIVSFAVTKLANFEC